MAHDQPEAPKEGHLLGLLSLVGFWGPEGTVSRSRGPSQSLRPRQRDKNCPTMGPAPLPGTPHLSPETSRPARPSRRPRPRASLSQRSSSTSTTALELLERPSRRGAHLTPSSSCPASPYLPSPGQSSGQCNLVLCSSDFSIVPSPVSLTPHLWHGALSSLAQGSVELRPGR